MTSDPRSFILSHFADYAWDMFTDNVSENEHELADFVEDYEMETGDEIPWSYVRTKGGELKYEPFVKWVKPRVIENATEGANQIIANLSGNEIRAWRALEAPIDWKPSAPNPGVHWSVNKKQAIAHFAPGNPNDSLFLIEAMIPVGSIDWPLTVKANLSTEFGEEEEIRINDDAPVRIISVKRKKSPEMVEESVRPAYLYHATSLAGLMGIISSDRINASDEVKRNRPEGFPADEGVSLTRSIHFAKDWAHHSSERISEEPHSPIEGAEAKKAPSTGAIIVFDTQSLANRFKMRPVDDLRNRQFKGGTYGHPEAEELLSGDLTNVKRYIAGIKILATPDQYAAFKNEVKLRSKKEHKDEIASVLYFIDAKSH